MAKEAAAGVVVDGADGADHGLREVGCGGSAIGGQEEAAGVNAIEQDGDLAIGEGVGLEGGEVDHHGGCRGGAVEDEA